MVFLRVHQNTHRQDGREHPGGHWRHHLMLPSGRTLRARRFAPVHLAPLGSIYDIQRAVADKTTVPIYCDSRISKLSLNAAESPKLDADFLPLVPKVQRSALGMDVRAAEHPIGHPERSRGFAERSRAEARLDCVPAHLRPPGTPLRMTVIPSRSLGSARCLGNG